MSDAILADNVSDDEIMDAVPFLLLHIKEAHSKYSSLPNDTPIKQFSITCFRGDGSHWNCSVTQFMATEADPACKSQHEPITEGSNPTVGPPQSDISALDASSLRGTLDPESETFRPSPGTTSDATSQGHVTPPEEQKTDGLNAVFVSDDVVTMEQEKAGVDVPPDNDASPESILDVTLPPIPKSTPDVSSHPASLEDPLSDTGNHNSTSLEFPEDPEVAFGCDSGFLKVNQSSIPLDHGRTDRFVNALDVYWVHTS